MKMEESQQTQNANKSYKKLIYIATVLGFVAAIFLTVTPEIGRGSFLHGILGFYAAVIAFGSYIVGRIIVHFKPTQLFSRICIALAIVLAFCFLSIFTGNIVLDFDIQQTKSFCEHLVPLLNAYQKENGEYPASLNKILPKDKKLPMIVRSDNFYYNREGDSFSFSFSDPGGMMNGWAYSAKRKEWYEWD